LFVLAKPQNSKQINIFESKSTSTPSGPLCTGIGGPLSPDYTLRTISSIFEAHLLKINLPNSPTMQHKTKSIRPFIGAKNYDISRNFYRDLGFKEIILSHNMCYFETNNIGFYLQDAYVKDWIDNTMIFVEVDNVERYFKALQDLNLSTKYKNARLINVVQQPWGSECFLHDPSGILWHFGAFI
jgi:catechol 2,3-dioxygenase-like lactoylglutathione lyase family enzyme